MSEDSSSERECKKKRCADAVKPYQPCCCRCPRKLNAYAICKENLHDIAECLVKILKIFGVNEQLANTSRKFIFMLFHHYDYARLSYTEEKPPHLTKNKVVNLLFDLHHMSRVEAELTYYCVKRAFKAYFHNKCRHGLNNPILDAEITAQDTGAWRHCARVTARIFEEKYINLFPTAQINYELEIRGIYRDLCTRMNKRMDPQMVQACKCKGCASVQAAGRPEFNRPASTNINKWEIFGINLRDCKGKTIPPYRTCVGKEAASGSPDPDADCLNKKQELETPAKLKFCFKCKRLKILCDCEDMAGRVEQGPYETYWNRVYDDECDRHYVAPGHLLKDAEHHHCPIDCCEFSFLSACCSEDDDDDSVDSEQCSCEGDDAADDDESYTENNFVQEACCCQEPDDIGI